MKTTCEKCGGPLQLRTSTNEKQCYDCLTVFSWRLDKDQKPLF